MPGVLFFLNFEKGTRVRELKQKQKQKTVNHLEIYYYVIYPGFKS